MFEILLNVLEAALSLWNDKEKTKYIDQVKDLKLRYYEEYNKAPSVRSDAVLDNIEFELCVLGSGFAASAGSQRPPAQS